MFERISKAGRFTEDEVFILFVYFSYHSLRIICTCNLFLISMLQARFFFQQLISGVSYCHSMVIGLLSILHYLI